MGADDHRSPLTPLSQVMQNLMLRTAIHCRERIIKNQDLGLQQQRAGYGNALLLPTRKHHATLTDLGVISLRQAQNILMYAGEPRYVFDLLLRSVRSTQRDIAGDGIGK